VRISDYEQFCLGAALLDHGAARLLLAELPETSFCYDADGRISDAHRKIFRAIQAVLMDKNSPDVGTVAIKLGKDLDSVGGRDYLTYLTQVLPSVGIFSTAGLPQWAAIVDQAGRLRQIKTVVDGYGARLSDFERALNEIEDVDAFLSDFLQQIQSANTIKSEYEHVSKAIHKAQDMLTGEASGKAISWQPVGWPSLTPYRLLPLRSMFVIMGISSMGKSQLLAQFLMGAAIQIKRQGKPGCVVLNTYEMGGDRYALRMASSLTKVDLNSPEAKDKTTSEFAALMNALDFIGTLPIYFNDGDMTSFQILNQTTLLGAQHGGVRVVGIDYAELVPDRGAQSEELRVSGIFRNSQRLSRSMDGPCVIVASQFNSDFKKNNDYKLGSVDMTRYSNVGHHAADVSGIIYNPVQMRKAAMSFQLHPDCPDADHAYLFIGKNKEGRLGWIKLNWTPECTRLADPALIGFGNSILYEGLNDVYHEVTGPNTVGDF